MHVLTVDEQLVNTARARATAEREMAVSAEQLYATFEDESTWPQWVPGMREATWTSPKPFGKGTTRAVTMAGGVRIDELFWAWGPGRIGFNFAATSIGWVDGFAELYEITPVSSERCRLRWTIAMSVPRIPSRIEPLLGRVMTIHQGHMLKALERVAVEHAMTV